MEKFIHVVSFDVPFPANYGGVIDVFHRIKALHHNGYNIILHCFEYGREKQLELEKITHKTHYYKRKNLLLSFFNSKPLIVVSRKNKLLLKRLSGDSHPIIFEGQHCSSYLSAKALKNKLKLVRIHNVEHEYYHHLFKQESNILKKLFFYFEALKLKKHEKNLRFADQLLCITQKEADYYKNTTATEVLNTISPFKCNLNTDLKPYSLFHGNLSVIENHTAALWLIQKIAPFVNHAIIIAGKNPKNSLIKASKQLENVKIISNPDDNHLSKLINEAQSHILWTNQNTGIKLKLLHALSSSGEVIVNNLMVEGTGLENFCTVINTEKSLIQYLVNPKNIINIEGRHNYVESLFSEKNTINTIDKLLSNKQ